MMPANFDSFTEALENCARCGGDHDEIKWEALENPYDEFEWWGQCPETGQPILLALGEEEEVPGV